MAKKQSAGKRVATLAKLIENYYADLQALTYQRVFAEMGTRTAFHTLNAKLKSGRSRSASVTSCFAA